MKSTVFFLFLIASFSFIQITKADSPLTSTDIATAYANEDIIKKASKANGILTNELMEYLYNKKNPIDIKLAVINKLSWSTDGKKNAELFWNFLNKKNKKYKSLEDFKKKGTADHLICYAYLKALDNYFDVKAAAEFAVLAKSKDKKKRYSLHLVCGLIEAQNAFDSDWCELWKCTDRVRQDKSLKQDLKSEAVKNVFEYMDLYKDDCK